MSLVEEKLSLIEGLAAIQKKYKIQQLTVGDVLLVASPDYNFTGLEPKANLSDNNQEEFNLELPIQQLR